MKLALGHGPSSLAAIREADNDPENWNLAAKLMPDSLATLPAAGDQWCVLVDDPDECDLDADRAVWAYVTVTDSY